MRDKIIPVIILVFFVSCKTLVPHFSQPYEKIPTLPGPEDMVLDTVKGDNRLIIACSERRNKKSKIAGFQTYSFATGKIRNMLLENMPDSIELHPHGIDIGMLHQQKILWVINHEDSAKRQLILMFRIEQDQLFFTKAYQHRFIISPNDVCDGGNGSFYFTNDASSRHSTFELLFKIKGGSIVRCDENGNFTMYKTRFSYPNGLIKNGNSLLISTSRQNSIYSIPLDERGNFKNEKPELIVKGICWDNFSRLHQDMFICTSHHKPLQFMKHAQSCIHKSPVQVYSIQPDKKTKGLIYQTDGEAINAGSTAIYYQGDLYICQVFDPYIVKINLHHTLD